MAERIFQPSQQIGLLITYRCNLNCKYCYIKSKQHIDMSYEQAITILQKYLNREEGCLDITFYGGETLIVFENIKMIVEWALQNNWKRKYKFFGCTNGTLLKDSDKDWLKKHSDVIVLGLSYDGVQEVQLMNRGSKNIDLDFFIETWPQQPIQMTVNARSVYKMADGVKYLLKKGAKVNPNVAYEEYEWSENAITEYEKQLSILVNFYDDNTELPMIGELNYDLVKIASNIDNPLPVGRSCGAGDGFVLYDVDGYGYPCHLLSPLVLNKSQLRQLSRTFNIHSADFSDSSCLGCPFTIVCSSCLACNYIYRGAYGKRDATHCKITKIDIRASMRRVVSQLLKKDSFFDNDAQLVDSINKLNFYFKNKIHDKIR